jgi:hypothetical protein
LLAQFLPWSRSNDFHLNVAPGACDEWMRENGNLTAGERDQGVDDLIALVGAVDGILQMQAKSDAAYFKGLTGKDIESTFLSAYRWQYIVSGVQDKRFNQILGGMITAEQGERIGAALKPILG